MVYTIQNKHSLGEFLVSNHYDISIFNASRYIAYYKRAKVG